MRIPTPGIPETQTRPLDTRLPNTRIDRRGTYGEAIVEGGQGLMRGIAAVQAVEYKAKKEAEDFRLDEADLRFRHGVNELTYGKEKGFLNKLGQNAFDPEPTMEELRKLRSAIEQELPDENLRRRFALRAGAHTEQAWVSMQKHTSEQRRATFKHIADGQVAESLDLIRKDPDRVMSEVEQLFARGNEPGPVRNWLLSQGLPAEQMEKQEQEVRGMAYGTAIDSYLATKRWDLAELLFSEAQGDLGERAAKYRKEIDTVKAAQESERIALQAVSRAVDPESMRVDEAAARAAVDEVPEGPLRDAARERVEQRIVAAKREREAHVDVIYNRAFGAYLTTKSRDAISHTDAVWLQTHAGDDWWKIESRMQSDADRARALRERGRNQETDEQREAYLELQSDMARNPEKYLEMTPEAFTREWGHRLSDNGYKAGGTGMTRLQAKEHEITERGQRTNRDQFRSHVISEAVQGGIKSEKVLGIVQARMNTWLWEYLDHNDGRFPTHAEVDKQLGHTFGSHEVRAYLGLGTKTKKGYELEPDDQRVSGPDPAPTTRQTPPRPQPQTSAPSASDFVTVRRKSDGKTKRLTREQAQAYSKDSNYEVK